MRRSQWAPTFWVEDSERRGCVAILPCCTARAADAPEEQAMSPMQDRTARPPEPGRRELETCSRPPPMRLAQRRRQAGFVVTNGSNPAIEHAEPGPAATRAATGAAPPRGFPKPA